MESIESSPSLLHEPKVAVSPRNGFGEDSVRVALIENEHRTRHAVRGTRKALGAGSDVSVSHG
jgi:alanine-synthesizing transaminase